MEALEKLRIDKYLWAIRLFKTRSLATDACKAGRIKLEKQNLKPSYLVKIGDIYTIQKGVERRVIKVIDLLTSRVDAKAASSFYEELTPIEHTRGYKAKHLPSTLSRDPGSGRPTKKERREIDDLQDNWFN